MPSAPYPLSYYTLSYGSFGYMNYGYYYSSDYYSNAYTYYKSLQRTWYFKVIGIPIVVCSVVSLIFFIIFSRCIKRKVVNG